MHACVHTQKLPMLFMNQRKGSIHYDIVGNTHAFPEQVVYLLRRRSQVCDLL